MIAKFGIWIFLCAATFKFTFWIIDMVDGFKWKAGEGVRALFYGLFEMIFYLIILAVILEVSRKIAEKYTAAELAPKPATYAAPQQANYQQVPVQPQAPVQQVAPQAAPAPQAASAQQAAPVAPTNGVWYCAGCGTQNTADAAFCAKCGKPK